MSDINTGVEQWGNDLIERTESAAEKYGVECHGVPLNIGWFLDLLDAAVRKERAEATKESIDECMTILKAHHMLRTCEDDYIPKIERPFYQNLWNRFEQLKEQNKTN